MYFTTQATLIFINTAFNKLVYIYNWIMIDGKYIYTYIHRKKLGLLSEVRKNTFKIDKCNNCRLFL